MLHSFLTKEKKSILADAKERATETQGIKITSDKVEEGWGIFYDELIGLLKADEKLGDAEVTKGGIHTEMAVKQGKEYMALGYTVSEVVHSYGALCQAITGTATKLKYNISNREFQQLNLSLDTVIAEAVTAFEGVRGHSIERAEVKRLGYLSHELRNCLQSATLALQMIEGGSVGIRSNTGSVLRSSLIKMAELIDTALTEVRLRSEPEWHPQRTKIFELMSDVGATAGFEARTENRVLLMHGFGNLEVEVDQQLFVSALSNLVQNALKFSKPGGTIQVRAHEVGDRVLIEVEDECGGLHDGKIEALFEPGVQMGKNKSGLGLGLSISRTAIERNKGELRVENLPGKGCIFIIDLPKAPPLQEGAVLRDQRTDVPMK